MKMPKNRLWLHTELMPLIYTLGRHEEDKLDARLESDPDGDYTIDPLIVAMRGLSEAIVFDCRALPLDFVLDTGDSVCEEPSEIRGPIRLPFQTCYFEFSNQIGVLAMLPRFVEDADGNEVKIFAVPILVKSFHGDDKNNPLMVGAMFHNEIDKPLFEALKGGGLGGPRLAERGCKLLLGVLGLMKEKFITETLVPDPAPRLTKVRARKSKYPISSESRVLTVNVAAVRRISSKTRLKEHESPALHWRRGHWRVLHRGSEFESTTWVHRCLVGDPARGYIQKGYRLIWSPEMLRPTISEEA